MLGLIVEYQRWEGCDEKGMAKILEIDLNQLKRLIFYPQPRLGRESEDVTAIATDISCAESAIWEIINVKPKN